MKQCVNKFLTGTFVCALIISGCATTSYNQKKSSDDKKQNKHETVSEDFYQIRMADNIYQVGMKGRDHYSWQKISAFLLRGCAQITLEHGKRYFTLFNPIDSSFSSYSEDSSTYEEHFYFQQATLKILPDGSQPVKLRLDAVAIVNSTKEIVGDKLSKKARETFEKLEPASNKSK